MRKIRKHVAIIAMALAFILGCIGMATAQSPTPTVKLTVLGDNDVPLQGAYVTVYQESSQWYSATGTDVGGKVDIPLVNPAPDWTKGVYAVAFHNGYFDRFYGDVGFWWEALPIGFDQITSVAEITIHMVKRPVRLGVNVYLNGAPVNNMAFSIPNTGGKVLAKVWVVNDGPKATFTVKAAFRGASAGTSDASHWLDRLLKPGVQTVTLEHGQAKWLSFQEKLHAGLRNVSYQVVFEVDKGWQNVGRWYTTVCKGNCDNGGGGVGAPTIDGQ